MSILKRFGEALALAALALSTAACSPTDVTLSKNAFWNLPTGVTSLSREEWGLHMMMFWVCVVIAIVVFGVMAYELVAFRRSKHPVPAKFKENSKIEIAWTIVPFLILVATALPAANTLVKAYNTSDQYMTVNITGTQWRWVYQYPDFGVGYISSIDAASDAASVLGSGISPKSIPHYLRNVDHEMVVPVGKKIRVLITSVDVMHGWAVPDLGVRKDANPGIINEAWFNADRIGTYRGNCSVLCGRGHGFMPVVVKVVSMADFKTWITAEAKAGHTFNPGSVNPGTRIDPKNGSLGDAILKEPWVKPASAAPTPAPNAL